MKRKTFFEWSYQLIWSADWLIRWSAADLISWLIFFQTFFSIFFLKRETFFEWYYQLIWSPDWLISSWPDQLIRSCWSDDQTDQQLIWLADKKMLEFFLNFGWSADFWNFILIYCQSRIIINWSFRQTVDWPEQKYCQLIFQRKTWLSINTWLAINTLFVTFGDILYTGSWRIERL